MYLTSQCIYSQCISQSNFTDDLNVLVNIVREGCPLKLSLFYQLLIDCNELEIVLDSELLVREVTLMINVHRMYQLYPFLDWGFLGRGLLAASQKDMILDASHSLVLENSGRILRSKVSLLRQQA